MTERRKSVDCIERLQGLWPVRTQQLCGASYIIDTLTSPITSGPVCTKLCNFEVEAARFFERLEEIY